MTEEPYHDKKDQLQKIRAYVIPGEVLYAVLDMKGGGTGFVGITDKRLIFLDQAFVKKSKAMVSIPFSRINAVVSADSGAVIFGTSSLRIMTGGREWDFEFRSNEKAHYAYGLIMKGLLQVG